jgi:hypothetical protein
MTSQTVMSVEFMTVAALLMAVVLIVCGVPFVLPLVAIVLVAGVKPEARQRTIIGMVLISLAFAAFHLIRSALTYSGAPGAPLINPIAFFAPDMYSFSALKIIHAVNGFLFAHAPIAFTPSIMCGRTLGNAAAAADGNAASPAVPPTAAAEPTPY